MVRTPGICPSVDFHARRAMNYSVPTPAVKLRRLPWSIAANFANTFFAQFTYFGSVFVLFLGELGMSKSQIGLYLSLFPFSGLLALFIAPAVARFGFKRTVLIFFGSRKIVTALLLLTPWLVARAGPGSAWVLVGVVVFLFAVCRAIAETAIFPWIQEYVPKQVRGKYSGLDNLFVTSAGFLAVTFAGFLLGRHSGLRGFMILISIGVGFGLLAWLCTWFIPGGTPERRVASGRGFAAGLSVPIKDSDFRRYLTGTGLYTLATVPLLAFLPLFLQEEAGLSRQHVVWLQSSTLLGTLLSSFLWGWSSDRYGSKPILVSGVALTLVMPVAWMLLPRGSSATFPVAIAIAFLQGVANVGWIIGSARWLFVGLVPPDKRSSYMALYYAWIGLTGGLSQLFAGRIVDVSKAWEGSIFWFTIDPFLVLFVLGIVLPAVSIPIFNRVKDHSLVSATEFAGMFLRGNPFRALESSLRYHLASDEHSTISITERLGQVRSPLNNDELLEALEDPRLNVQIEAMISITRTRPDARLFEALNGILGGEEPTLSAVAAWAFGRTGDRRAVAPLMQALESSYPSVRAHSARALSTLGAHELAPRLMQELRRETDPGLVRAYACALGKMRFTPALGLLLEILRMCPHRRGRIELALAIARIVGNERGFIQLWRQLRKEPAMTASLALDAVARKLKKGGDLHSDNHKLVEKAMHRLADEDLVSSQRIIAQLIDLLPHERYTPWSQEILKNCQSGLAAAESFSIIELLLALHTLLNGYDASRGYAGNEM